MLTQRRQWFQCFPEGTIEFNLVTRIGAIGMMGAFAVLPENQHILIANGLVGALWIDFLLMIGWTVQLGSDLETIIHRPEEPARQAHRRSLFCFLWAALPTIPAMLILAPWPEVIIRNEASRVSLMRILDPVLGVCFMVSLALAMRAVKRLQLAAGGWIFLWFFPVLHLLALHRIIKATQTRIQRHRLDTGLGPDERHLMGGSLIAADLLWLSSLVPWLILTLKSWQDSAFIVRPMGTILIIAGTVMFAILSAVQLSLMERLQQQFLGLIHRKEDT